MTEEEFKDLEKKYFQEKEVQELKKEISFLCCPVCGQRLTGRIGEPKGDTLDFKAYIDCNRCNLFHAESKSWYSNYRTENNVRVSALKDVMKIVDPHIRVIAENTEDKE